jgi:fermentation-respiration switch protein FrsA (DUF1100 family)
VTAPPSRRLRATVIRVLLLLLVAQTVLAGGVALAKNRFLFFPSARPLAEERLDAFGDADARVVRIVRPDGRRLAAYDVVPRGLPADAPVVLFLHGNAGNIATRAELAAWFARTAGVRLLMPDYSGYGGNEGSPSEGELYVDALAAFDHLVASGVAPGRIVVYGESIGGAPALLVATKRRVAGVVVQSTLSSLSSMAWRKFWFLPLDALLVGGALPNASRIAELECPVLIVHGTEDRIIPFAEGERLHAAAPRAEFLRIEGADHNDLLDVAGDAYLRGLGERFRRWR